MIDRREKILSRIADICKSVRGLQATYRNVDDISELLRPAVVLKDGNEVASDANEHKQRIISNLVDLYPEIWILVGGDTKTMPAALAPIRMQLIAALTNDATLVSLAGSNGNIRYLGCDIRDQYGVLLNGEMILRWQFTYPIRPQDFV